MLEVKVENYTDKRMTVSGVNKYPCLGISDKRTILFFNPRNGIVIEDETCIYSKGTFIPSLCADNFRYLAPEEKSVVLTFRNEPV